MSIKLLINASDPEEIRVATVKDGRLEEFRIESAAREITQGNIYKAVVTRVEPSLQAAFVDYGGDRNGFLQKHDIHYDYFHEEDDGSIPLHRLVKRGQGIMVQVGKDPIGTKGAMLTTLISLPGRYVVLMPGHSVRGVSRKIEDEAERGRLKEIVAELELPDGFGVIVRTAGMGCTKTMISKDLKDLLRLWKTIKGKVAKEKKTALLYKERALVLRSIRDSFSPDVSEILIDEPAVFERGPGARQHLREQAHPGGQALSGRKAPVLRSSRSRSRSPRFSKTGCRSNRAGPSSSRRPRPWSPST